MKFELICSTSRDRNRLIFSGNWPHNPKETNDSFCKLESLVKTVKNDSSENLSERACSETAKLLFPTMVSSVMWLLEQTSVREGFGGNVQKFVHLFHCSRAGGYSRNRWIWNRILVSVEDNCANENGKDTRKMMVDNIHWCPIFTETQAQCWYARWEDEKSNKKISLKIMKASEYLEFEHLMKME